MSGLKLVPRIPKWPSTTNGSEAATQRREATGQPAAQRLRPAPSRPRR